MSTDSKPAGMTLGEAGRILAVAIVLDPRLPQPDAQGFIRQVWHDALKALPFPDAYEAVIAYYSSEEYRKDRNPIAPADIVAGVRKLRSVGNAPLFKALPGAAVASDETRTSAMEAARELFARYPRFKRTFALPWSQQGRPVKSTAQDAARRAEAQAEIERLHRERGGS